MTHQPTRVVHVKRDSYEIYIGRTMPGTDYRNAGWGNPIRHGVISDPVQSYRSWLLGQRRLIERIPELRGRVLGCWCAPQGGIPGNVNGHLCHGEILAAYADDPQLLAAAVAEFRAVAERIEQLAESLALGKCPECGAKVERERQVGRCVYAEPCGHRMYQGLTRANAERSQQDREAIIRCGNALSSHVHVWQAWGADSRYQRCASCGQVRKVNEESEVMR